MARFSIGPVLKKCRIDRKIDFLEAQHKLKLSVRDLGWIEDGNLMPNFEQLKVFRRVYGDIYGEIEGHVPEAFIPDMVMDNLDQ